MYVKLITVLWIMKTEKENLLVLLRGLARGNEFVVEDHNGNYAAEDCHSWPEYIGCELKTIESRIQYELYGEYPLSPINQSDWDRVTCFAFKSGYSIVEI